MRVEVTEAAEGPVDECLVVEGVVEGLANSGIVEEVGRDRVFVGRTPSGMLRLKAMWIGSTVRPSPAMVTPSAPFEVSDERGVGFDRVVLAGSRPSTRTSGVAPISIRTSLLAGTPQ